MAFDFTYTDFQRTKTRTVIKLNHSKVFQVSSERICQNVRSLLMKENRQISLKIC